MRLHVIAIYREKTMAKMMQQKYRISRNEIYITYVNLPGRVVDFVDE